MKEAMERAATILALVVLAAPLRAEAPFALRARIEPDPVPFGGRFEVVVELTRPEGEELRLPEDIPETPAVRRAGEPTWEAKPANEPGLIFETLRIPYLALDYGDVKTPAIVLLVPGKEPLEIPALPLKIEEAPAFEGEAAPGKLPLEPAAGPFLYSVFDPRPLVALFGVAFSGAALFAYRLLARRRRPVQRPARSAHAIKAPTRPPDEEALSRLEALLAEGLLAKGEVALFVTRLMDEVLRFYLEARFDVAAGKRTTRELSEGLLARSAPGLDLEALRSLLEHADLVKFARADVAAEAAHEMAGKVRVLIERTRQRAEAAAPSEARA